MFTNREEAGMLLAKELEKKDISQDTLILAIPRGGVIIGKVISEALHARLFPLIIKKIGYPKNPELAIGAIGSKNTVYWEDDIIRQLHIKREERKYLKETKKQEVRDREKYLGSELPSLTNRAVIVVDDGVATGATAKAGAKLLKKMKAGLVLLATPIISEEAYIRLTEDYDQIIFIKRLQKFHAIGEFYKEFNQVSDEEVREMLNK